MKYLIFLLTSLLSFTSQAGEGIDISSFIERSKAEIIKSYPKIIKNNLVLVDLDVNVKSKKLNESYFEISLVDKGSLHSDEISKYAYDRYIVSFNILSGDLDEVIQGGWGSYQEIGNSIIK
ncbi:hypothetical protein CYL31_11955 [Marinomonas sp. A3A]|uniref:hypothetical protein n=1 Tax=Marinomonas sp. A3A TaxID=2065312 RepID=UPI001BB303F9|nr:hypothetical protein [Marinomonas sp. A3A]QUX92080.1 hypothetical protein CYL31_11955 [Marinomonas sp. A3A]